MTLSTDGSDFDTVLAVYTGTGDNLDSLQLVACDNDSGQDGRESRVSFTAAADTINFLEKWSVRDLLILGLGWSASPLLQKLRRGPAYFTGRSGCLLARDVNCHGKRRAGVDP